MGLQFLGVDIYLDLPLLAAVWVRYRAPCTVANWVRMKFVPKSFSCCSVKPAPESPSCNTGTLDALYWMTKGGVVPCGYSRNDACAIAVIWATACEMFTRGGNIP